MRPVQTGDTGTAIGQSLIIMPRRGREDNQESTAVFMWLLGRQLATRGIIERHLKAEIILQFRRNIIQLWKPCERIRIHRIHESVHRLQRVPLAGAKL